ncbi:MAG TPA: prephenate dehydrogenase/arogenate dehydrogenase family protein [Methanoregulaceae archaeon]|nr:prephenate dehydrogenase/arogenate dehydrogenase family protein [Methanoregulaceae archaeon]
MKAGIIGGTGKMGNLFLGVFKRAGYEVLVSGRKTRETNLDIAKESDLVVITVPIRETREVIREIAPYLGPGQVVCDLTSLKVFPVEEMLKSEAEVIGFHPMFGPSVPSLRKQTIIVTPARCSKETVDRLTGVFTREGALITITTPEDHDRMMAIVQGLTHFVTIAMAETMRRTGIRPEDTVPFMSPVYQIETGIVGRLLSQDARLYADMLCLNPYVPAVIGTCREAIGETGTAVISGDADEFERIFGADAKFFGDFAGKGASLTDFLIGCMVKR